MPCSPPPPLSPAPSPHFSSGFSLIGFSFSTPLQSSLSTSMVLGLGSRGLGSCGLGSWGLGFDTTERVAVHIDDIGEEAEGQRQNRSQRDEVFCLCASACARAHVCVRVRERVCVCRARVLASKHSSSSFCSSPSCAMQLTLQINNLEPHACNEQLSYYILT